LLINKAGGNTKLAPAFHLRKLIEGLNLVTEINYMLLKIFFEM
jgi:hypothetical protein